MDYDGKLPANSKMIAGSVLCHEGLNGSEHTLFGIGIFMVAFFFFPHGIAIAAGQEHLS